MTDNVTGINGNAVTSPSEASDECVKVLSEWLEMAKSGQIVSLAISAVSSDDSLSVSEITEYQANTTLIIGSLEVNKLRLLTTVTAL